MQKKNFALIVALGVLAFMAIASEKRILVAEGFALTREELDYGRLVYENFCRSCHEQGDGGAPRTGEKAAWGDRTPQGLAVLITHAVEGFRGKTGWMPPRGGSSQVEPKEVSLAVGYMLWRLDVEQPR